VHGHTYTVIIELSDVKLNEVGFVLDYRKLSIVKEFIDQALDHKDLNDFLTFNPTAENIAKYLYELFKPQIPQLSAVSVKETPKTLARYTPQYD
jgi:6-pyruvoyltetrahydropterin/6-carboxytetrahydropterin synthase